MGESMGLTNDDTASTTRRGLLAGAGAAGVAVTLAACGTASNSGSTGTTSTGGAAGGGGGDPIKAADIPVNGGKIFQNTDTVVTQPASGEFKAFSATCTHMGCTVGSVENNVIHCPCHGSAYNASDGSVKNGPATKGLTPKTVTVSGDSLTVS
jgi:Rieske Fe-S protein